MNTSKKNTPKKNASKNPKKSKNPKNQAGVLARLVVVQTMTALFKNQYDDDFILGADTLLISHPDFIKLDSRDRGFARHVLMTTLRHMPHLDARLATKIKRKPKPAVMHVLRMSLAQLFYMDTPPHAVVSSALNVLDALRMSGAKGLANAVLRHLKNTDNTPVKSMTAPWFWQMMVDDYGVDTATAIAGAHLIPPALDVTVKSDVQGWADRLGGTVLSPDNTHGFGGTVRLTGGGELSQMDGYDDGAWWVQDAGACLPAKLLGNALIDIRGKRIADICAAPGGKTMQLLSAGADVTAIDNNANRLLRLQENLERTQMSAPIVCANGAEYQPETPFDGVLVDAPCSATGTVRRHPELPLLKTESDFDALADIQKSILKNAVAITESGGIIVYAVCSLRRAEGDSITTWALDTLPVTLSPIIQAEIPTPYQDTLQSDGSIRILPSHGMDGFYCVRLRKK